MALIRTGLVLDTEGGLLKQLLLPFKLGVGGPLGGGAQYMPWIHRDDEVGLFLWALDTESASGVLNGAAPNAVTNKVFSKALGKALHRPAFMPAPKFAVTALRGQEMAGHVMESQRVYPRRPLDLGYVFRFPEIEPAPAGPGRPLSTAAARQGAWTALVSVSPLGFRLSTVSHSWLVSPMSSIE